MSAEERVIKAQHMAKVRELDFVNRFNGNINALIRLLGVTRRIPKEAGADLYALKAVGTLQGGNVAEGDVIPLSQFETVKTKVGEIELLKWRKATTAEAILKGGLDQSINMTNEKCLKLVQADIRQKFFSFLASGTSFITGTSFQAAIAKAWGQLQVKFEDEAIEAVYFLNPLDVADYLAGAQISIQNAFGMQYVENFLGLGTVFLDSRVPSGKVYATAKENIILYYVNCAGGDFGDVFSMTVDQTGLIGIHEETNYERMQSESVVASGIWLGAERLDGVVIGSFYVNLEVAPEAQTTTVLGKSVSDLQGTDFKVTGLEASGTVKYVTGYTGYSGEVSEQSGNYIALKCAAVDGATIKCKTIGGSHDGRETTLDSDMNVVFRIESTSNKLLFTATKDGKVDTHLISFEHVTLETA